MSQSDQIQVILGVIGFAIAIITYVLSSWGSRRIAKRGIERERVRATLTEFAAVRRLGKDLAQRINDNPDSADVIIKGYISELERFAVGLTAEAYSIDIVNQMSGGNLVSTYRKYLRPYIWRRRTAYKEDAASKVVKHSNLYLDYECMMKRLYKLRGLEWEPVSSYIPPREDLRGANSGQGTLSVPHQSALFDFLSAEISSSSSVFKRFVTLPKAVFYEQAACNDGSIGADAETKQRFVYIPGTRKDRCLLVAHADTVYDKAYEGMKAYSPIDSNDPVFDGVHFRNKSKDCGIGADDRAGCAILWLLRNSGHSLLILDGEEHGQIGAHYLKDNHPDIFAELNNHAFALELDCAGSRIYKTYDLPVSTEFEMLISQHFNAQKSESSGKTDICVLCEKICGANIGIGYYGQHRPDEIVVYKEWLEAYELVCSLLENHLDQHLLTQ